MDWLILLSSQVLHSIHVPGKSYGERIPLSQDIRMGTYENREEFPKTLILKSLTPAPRVTGAEIPAQASMVTSRTGRGQKANRAGSGFTNTHWVTYQQRRWGMGKLIYLRNESPLTVSTVAIRFFSTFKGIWLHYYPWCQSYMNAYCHGQLSSGCLAEELPSPDPTAA